MKDDGAAVVARLAASLAPSGLDLVAPFAAARVDPALWRAPDVGRADPLGVVVGNTQAMWPRFLAARPAGEHPLQRYVMDAVNAAAAALPVRSAIVWAHEPPFVPIQRLAELAGMAWLSPSHLAIHPVYGPWISLRAVVVADVEPPAAAPPAPACAHCEHACVPALEAALAASPATFGGVRASWRAWLAVRDACPTGRAHRFSDDHIRYGYTGVF